VLGKRIDLDVEKLLLAALVGIGGELLHVMHWTEQTFRCGASRFCTHGRIQGLPALGRPCEDAADAADRSMPDNERGRDLGGGRGWAGTIPRRIDWYPTY
jgi:hypothetical protein